MKSDKQFDAEVNLAHHVLSMRDDAYLSGHPEWLAIVEEAENIVDPLDIEDYQPENGEQVYTQKDFLEIAKGNRKYARSLRDRVTWQHPETLVEEDLREEEIREVNGTYEIVADDYEPPDPETRVFRAMEGGTDGG